MKSVLIISCEHASKNIPTQYSHLFINQQKLIKSHRGSDIGADRLYHAICKKKLATQHKAAQWSRLLIDLNRSLKNKNLFSNVTKHLSETEKNNILKNYYHPYRNWLSNHIHDYYSRRISVLHLSLHSFTPELNGEFRNNDVGLLYDPQRLQEKKFCENFKSIMHFINQDFKIRFNYPYRGVSDGFTSFLRKQTPNKYYLGIEIEMNQKHFDLSGNCKTSLVQDIVTAIEKVMVE